MVDGDFGVEPFPQMAVHEDIDAIISADIPNRGVIRTLYRAARGTGGESLTYRAASALFGRIKRGDVVLIATGAQFPGWPVTETDGPIGAAVLARALNIGLGALPLVITEDFNVPIVEAALRAANLSAVGFEGIQGLDHAAAVHSFPIEDSAGRQAARELFARVAPVAVISVEKPGWNRKRVQHSSAGFDLSSAHGKVDYLFELARKRHVLTLGIGDGGNEIGMGSISATVREKIPHGSLCQCPCRAGMAPTTKTDFLIAATVSNWGAYGLAASLAAILGNPEVLHNERIEAESIATLARMGAVDGFLGYPTQRVDGLDISVHVALVHLLRTRVETYVKGRKA